MQRMADQRMPDRHFGKMREGSKERQVSQIEIVPGVHAKSEGVRELRGGRRKS